MAMAKISAAEKFWRRVQRSDGCWLWTGPMHPHGYGIAQLGRTMAAHRAAFILSNGEIASGGFVCHHCDNRQCVRPDHLYLGDPRTNARDMVARDRTAKGARNGRYTKPERTSRGEGRPAAKLTWDDVHHIRTLAGLTSRKAMAEAFGVSVPVICNIVNNKAWRREYGP
jgi:hypothetical protein